jgi:hypothetical protein
MNPTTTSPRTPAATCAAFLALAMLALVTGCPPSDMPSYSADGRHIAVISRDVKGVKTLWLVDAESNKSMKCPLSGNWTLEAAQWIDNDLWVYRSRDAGEWKDPNTGKPEFNKDGQPLHALEFELAKFDAKTKSLVGGTIELAKILPDISEQEPVVIGFQEKLRLLVKNEHWMEDRQKPYSFDVYALENLSKLTSVALKDFKPAGRGWWIQNKEDTRDFATRTSFRIARKGAGGALGADEKQIKKGLERSSDVPGTADLVAVDVYNATGKKACTIRADEIAPASYRDVRFPAYARIAVDDSAILLVFDTSTIFRQHPHKYTFGMFDTKSGKLLWNGASDSLVGTPLVKRDEVWTLEMVDRKVYTGERTPAATFEAPREDPPQSKFALTNYRRTAKEAAREEVFQHDLGKTGTVGQFAPSPDGSVFLVTVDNGQRPLLLRVPINRTTTAKQVTATELADSSN